MLVFYIILYLPYILVIYLIYILAIFLTYILVFYPRLRSSGAHWAQKVPGWGPVVFIGVGRFLVEVQWCPLYSEPCGWDSAVPTQKSAVEVQQYPLRGKWRRNILQDISKWLLKNIYIYNIYGKYNKYKLINKNI